MSDQGSWTYSGQPARSPTLRDILAPMFRRSRLVVLSFLGIFLGAMLSGVLLPRQYEAQMKILVKRERVDPVVTTDRNAPLPLRPDVTEEELNSEVELLKSRLLSNSTSELSSSSVTSGRRGSGALRSVVTTGSTRSRFTRIFICASYCLGKRTPDNIAPRKMPRKERTTSRDRRNIGAKMSRSVGERAGWPE